MSAKRTERLLNLLFCLMAAPHAVTREQVRATVAGYSDSPSDDAFERMFERDKEELRGMGVPVDTVLSPGGEVEGYRIRRDDYSLPEIAFTASERAVLGLAAQVWQRAALAPAATSALRKLEADAPAPIVAAEVGVATRVAAGDAALLPLWSAVRDRRAVVFDYRKPGEEAATRRRVEPWGVVSWHGRWYVVGHDRDRHDARVFRLSRIVGDVRAAGEVGAFAVPEGVDVLALVDRSAPPSTGVVATVRVAPGRAQSLRRRARPSGDDPDLLHIDVADEEALASQIAAAGVDAIAVDPPEIVAAVRRRLAGALAAHPPAGAP